MKKSSLLTDVRIGNDMSQNGQFDQRKVKVKL